MGGGQAKDMGGGQAKDMGGGQAEDMLLDMGQGQAKDMVLGTSQRHGLRTTRECEVHSKDINKKSFKIMVTCVCFLYAPSGELCIHYSSL